ncbi:hypothetical protein XAC9322_540001 [Xanthomonas citri pv. citri]|nr:hypothetical protein XAC9322_540001 [Xanthomonas citri pv. citri]CEE47845.1 hypothetical protein XAC908_800001 [Xanthomonas citri pv. citri]CEE84054.1 hypothetical protein XACLC80_700001 [Xanthomonas citri pv. citri]
MNGATRNEGLECLRNPGRIKPPLARGRTGRGRGPADHDACGGIDPIAASHTDLPTSPGSTFH